jgi:hypothetical protein
MMNDKILGNPNEQWKKPYTAQGDCLIKKCGTKNVFSREYPGIPKDASPIAGGLALRGSSNSHAFFGGKFQLFEKDGTTFVRVDEPTVLDHVEDMGTRKHAEHHAQWIPKGEYFVDVVQERDHILEESRRIID